MGGGGLGRFQVESGFLTPALKQNLKDAVYFALDLVSDASECFFLRSQRVLNGSSAADLFVHFQTFAPKALESMEGFHFRLSLAALAAEVVMERRESSRGRESHAEWSRVVEATGKRTGHKCGLLVPAYYYARIGSSKKKPSKAPLLSRA